MAIYHCSIKIISRGKGKSAVAAAYRAGEKIQNEYDGIIHDYTRKGGVVHTEILLPDNAPGEYAGRSVLWNSVEKAERYKTAQFAREIELALPQKLSRENNIYLVRDYVNRNFVSAGMCADVAIHDKGDGNPHAHIMLTMRPIEKDGKWGAKSRTVNGQKINTVDWNEQTKAEKWRAAWADAVNAVLERQGSKERVDHRSFLRQGKEEPPTVHLGVSAAQMERKGIPTERGSINREIEVSNRLLRRLRARITKLKDWLKAETAKTVPSTLSDAIRGIMDRPEQRRYCGLMADPNMVARVLNYLQENQITDMAGLRKKVGKMYDRRLDMGDRLNRIDGRLHMLDEYIRHMGYYQEHGEIYRQYQQIRRPKKHAAFREQHYTEIALFESACRYLEQHLNGQTPPFQSWKEEREKLLTDRAALNEWYNTLKKEVREAEIVKRNVERLMSRNEQKQGLTAHVGWRGNAVDVLTLYNFKVDRGSCASLRMGTITLFNDIRASSSRRTSFYRTRSLPTPCKGASNTLKMTDTGDLRAPYAALKELLSALRECRRSCVLEYRTRQQVFA